MVRRFNSPTGLEPNQQVWLELHWNHSVEVERLLFNDIQLHLPQRTKADDSASHRWQIDEYLRGNNVVVLELRSRETIDCTGLQERRLVELQPFGSAELEIAEPGN